MTYSTSGSTYVNRAIPTADPTGGRRIDGRPMNRATDPCSSDTATNSNVAALDAPHELIVVRSGAAG
jgi:hypothetical protein